MSRRIRRRHLAGGVPPAILRALAGLALLGLALGEGAASLAATDAPSPHVSGPATPGTAVPGRSSTLLVHVPEPDVPGALVMPAVHAAEPESAGVVRRPFATAASFDAAEPAGSDAQAETPAYAAGMSPTWYPAYSGGNVVESGDGLAGGAAMGQPQGPMHRLGHWFHPHGHPPASPRATWLSRPFSVEWLLGAIWGGSMIDDWLEQRRGMFGALRIGWDADPYWGLKMRFALAETSLVDSPLAIQAQQEQDAAGGITEDKPWYWRFHKRRHVDMFLWDVSFVYYPLGDTRLRPYLTFGFGTVRMSFVDRLDREFAEISLGMPIGVGLKYRCNDWLAVLCEFTDNVAFTGGKGLNTMHELSLVGGMEIRFGGSRRSYWPWNPSRYSW